MMEALSRRQRASRSLPFWKGARQTAILMSATDWCWLRAGWALAKDLPVLIMTSMLGDECGCREGKLGADVRSRKQSIIDQR